MVMKPNNNMGPLGYKCFIMILLVVYFFNCVDEAGQCSLPNIFTILYELDQRYEINEQYEFLLEYPELSGFNRWKHKNGPII